MQKKIDPHTPAYSALIEWAVKRLSRPLHVVSRRLERLTIWDWVWLALIALSATLNIISLVRGLTGGDLGLTGNGISGLVLNAMTAVLMWLIAARRKHGQIAMRGLALALAQVSAYEAELEKQLRDNENALYKAAMQTERGQTQAVFNNPTTPEGYNK